MVTEASWGIALGGLFLGAALTLVLRHYVLGVDRDQEVWGLHEWRDEAQHNNAQAQYHLGNVYEHGIDAPVSLEKAFYWYARAASLGYPGAYHKISECYLEGRGTDQDFDRGVWWMEPGRARDKMLEARDMVAAIEASHRKAHQEPAP